MGDSGRIQMTQRYVGEGGKENGEGAPSPPTIFSCFQLLKQSQERKNNFEQHSTMGCVIVPWDVSQHHMTLALFL